MQGRHRQVRAAIVALLVMPVLGALPGAFATTPASSLCPASPNWRHVAIGETVHGELAANARCDFLLDLPSGAELAAKQVLLESTYDRTAQVSLSYRASAASAWVGVCQIEATATRTRCASDYPLPTGEYRLSVAGNRWFASSFSFSTSLVDVTQYCDLGTDPIPIAAGEIVRAMVAPELGARCLFRYDGVETPGEFVRFRLLEDVDVRLEGNVSRAPMGMASTCWDFYIDARVCSFPANGKPIFLSTVRAATGSNPAYVNMTIETGPVCVLDNAGVIPEGGSFRGRMAHFDDGTAACDASFQPLANSTSFYVANRVLSGSAMEAHVRYEAPISGGCTIVTFRLETLCGGMQNRQIPVRILLRESLSGRYSIGESEFVLSATSYDLCSFGLATLTVRPGAPIEASAPQLPLNGCKFRIVPPDGHVTTRVTVRSLDGAGLRFPVSGGSEFCVGNTYGGPVGSCTVNSLGRTVDLSVHHDSGWGPGRFSVEVAFEGPCSLGSDPLPMQPGALVSGSLRGSLGAACILELPPLRDGFYDLSWAHGPSIGLTLARATAAGSVPVACALRLPDLSAGSCAVEAPDAPLRIIASLASSTSQPAAFTIKAEARPLCSIESGSRPVALGERTVGFLHDYDGVPASCSFGPFAADPLAFDVLRGVLEFGIEDGHFTLASGDRSCVAVLACAVGIHDAEPMTATLTGRGPFAYRLESVNGCSVNANRGATLVEGEPIELALGPDFPARCALSFEPETGAARVRLDVEGEVAPLVSTRGAPTRESFECFVLAIAPCRVDLHGPVARVLVPSIGRESTFRLVARSEHYCSLGAGTHDLASGEPIAARLLDHPDAACEFLLPWTEGTDLAALAAQAVDGGFVVEARTPTRACATEALPGARVPCDVLLAEGESVRVRVSQRPGRADAVAFTLRADASRIPLLNPLAPIAGNVDEGFSRYFRIANSGPRAVATAPDLDEAPSLATLRGNVDLYVASADDLPGPASAICASLQPGRAEACSLRDGGGAIVAVRGVVTSGRFLVSLADADTGSPTALA